MGSIQQSTVKWFDAKKGYGFIDHPDGGNDVFVHYSQIDSDDDFKTLRTGQTVQFEMNDGPKGLHALSVTALSEAETPVAPSEQLPEKRPPERASTDEALRVNSEEEADASGATDGPAPPAGFSSADTGAFPDPPL